MLQHTTVGNNIAIGYVAMDGTAGATASTSNNNLFIGVDSGGGDWVDDAASNKNIGIGNNTLDAAMDGALYNTAVGYEALSGVTEGDANVGIGREAGKIISTGGTNVCVGNAAGQTITTGGQNICVGYAADVSASGSTYQFVIGYGITAAGDNDFAFGKSSNVVHNDFDADAAWSRTSDIRKKRNIKDDTLGLEFINKLKPVTHQWKPSNEFPEEWDEYSEENNMDLDVTIHNMIAQDVKQALDEVGCDTFGGWKEREDGSQSLSREMFITPLIKAVQELSAEVKSLKQQLEDK